MLRVKDTGIGIAPDVLPRVFDLFVQGRQAIDRSQGGLGLGLTIVRNLVERHRGSVSAHSDGPGRGSEFTVRLPKAAAASASDRGQRPRAGEGGPARIARRARRVLVVDDNEDAAEMLSEALTARGYETRVAHDAPAALRLAEGSRPDIAFLDIGLPVMDGYELADALRMFRAARHPSDRGTGYGQESDRQKSQAAGFHHHLVKPVDLDAIETVIDGEVAAAPLDGPGSDAF